ncbi:MAG: histidine phosphatase family protein [Planctomycetes bacterium]|nr:histidine phosphatase family protein [Planctomycetota bacterium]
MKVALIPCAASEWRDEGRLLGRVEVQATAAGEQAVAGWIQRLAPLGIPVVFHSPDELATRTAKLIAKALKVRTRKLADIAEVDVGLWAGLTEEELKKRYASTHHELCESPLHVCPPDGEEMAAAEQRLTAAVHKLIRKNEAAALALVARPLSLAITRWALEQSDESAIWHHAQEINEPVIIELDDTATRDNSAT